MTLIAKETGGGDYKMVPEGTHLARCYLLVDLGLQETKFGNKPQVVIGWEIPQEKLEDGRPMSITALYTNSLSELANLRKVLESWRSKKFTAAELEGFDLRAVLGVPCQVTVVHNQNGQKTYANVTAVTAIPKGLPVTDPINDTIEYDADGSGSFGHLPNWMQVKLENRITEDSGDFSDLEKAEDFEEDDLPF